MTCHHKGARLDIQKGEWIRLLPLGLLSIFATIAFISLPDNSQKIVQLGQKDLVASLESSYATVSAPDQAFSRALNEISIAEYYGEFSLAEEHIAKLVESFPGSPEIEFFRAILAVRKGEMTQAFGYLNSLKHKVPNDNLTLQLQSYISSIYGDGKVPLDLARGFGLNGNYQKAIRLFKKSFPSGMPTLKLKIELLAYQSHVESMWDKTLTEIRMLNDQYSNIDELNLLLANHIAQRFPKDVWVEETYSRLALGDGETAHRAAELWISSLQKEKISNSVISALAALKNRFPDDLNMQLAYRTALAKYIDRNEPKDDPFFAARENGLADLKAGNLKSAEKNLRYALIKRSKDERVLAGIGMIFQKRGSRDAISYFQRAIDNNVSPDLERKWKALKHNSIYIALLNEADDAKSVSAYGKSERILQSAIYLDNKLPNAYLKLAQLMQDQKRYAESDKYYKSVLRVAPMSKAAIWGRVNIHREAWGDQAAIVLINGFSTSQRSVVAKQYQELELSVAMQKIKDAKLVNNKVNLLSALNHALSLAPYSPWQRSDIAEEFYTLNETDIADKLMSDWVSVDSRPEMLYSYALYLERRGRLNLAIKEIELVAGKYRTLKMMQSLDRLRLNLLLEPLKKVVTPIDDSQVAVLEGIQAKYINNPSVLIKIANLWLDFEQREKANLIYQKLFSESEFSFEVMVAFLEVMLRLEHYSDFSSIWERLRSMASTNDQRENAERLNAKYYFSMGQQYEKTQKFSIAYSMYQRAVTISWSRQVETKIALLRLSSKFKNKAEYERRVRELTSESPQYSFKDSMLLVTALRETKSLIAGQQVLMQLKNRNDVRAQEWRDALHQAVSYRDWKSAEEFAYSALKSAQQNDLPPCLNLRACYESSENDWIERDVKSVINTIHDRVDGHIKFGLDYSSKPNGESFKQIPIDIRLPVPSLDSHILIRLDTVSVDSGASRYFDPATKKRLPNLEKALGTAIGLGLETNSWRADVGTTPVGFRAPSLVGGVALKGQAFETFNWRFAFSRRPETTSTLAYAGMMVPTNATNHSNQAWGGVVATGVKLGLGVDKGNSIGYWSGAQYHQLTGDSVEDNIRLSLSSGLYWRAINEKDRKLRLGASLMYLHYDKNLNEQTYNLADYYSPQSSVGIGFPVRYYGRVNNTLSYLLAGTISHSIKKEDSLYNLTGNGSSGGALAYSMEAAIEKRVSKHWYIGASTEIRRSESYNPNQLQIYAKYSFSDLWQPIHTPPEPVDLYSDFD